MKTVQSKKDYERRFRQWAKGTRYDGLLDKLESLYAERFPKYLGYEYYTETARTIEILSLASSVKNALGSNPSNVKSLAESFFKDALLSAMNQIGGKKKNHQGTEKEIA